MKNRRESRKAANRIIYIVSIAIITFLILIAATYTFSFLRQQKAVFNNPAQNHSTENLYSKGVNI